MTRLNWPGCLRNWSLELCSTVWAASKKEPSNAERLTRLKKVYFKALSSESDLFDATCAAFRVFDVGDCLVLSGFSREDIELKFAG